MQSSPLALQPVPAPSGARSRAEEALEGARGCVADTPFPLPQRRQYVSVFLDNASGAPVTVLGGSQFSAVSLGM